MAHFLEELDRKNIAMLVQRLRKAKGVSIQGFAKDSGLSRAMISKIEAGITTPTLTTLRKLAKAAGMTLSEVIAHLDSSNVFLKTSISEVESRHSKDGSFESFPIGVRGNDRQIEYFWFKFVSSGRHDAVRPIGTLVSIFVQSGSLVVETAGNTITLNAGDFVQFQPTKHYAYIQENKKLSQGFVVIRYR